MRLPLTPSQTVGPFLALGLAWEDGELVVPRGTPGAVWVRGVLYDGDGEPVPDGMIETWQAGPDGSVGSVGADGFKGFGRSLTGPDGTWGVRTLKPGPTALPEGGREAPHLNVSIFARGLLDRVVTRIYFADEAANETDPVLASVPAERRRTLLATPAADGYELDLHLQGGNETVFFDL